MRELIRLVSSAGTGHFYTTDITHFSADNKKPAWCGFFVAC